MKQSLMQQALGEQWHQLPKALKNHYALNPQKENCAVGKLDINYPWFMQWPLSFFRVLGALVNKRGINLMTQVSKEMQGDKECWQRSITFPDGKIIYFNSVFIYHKDNEFIEYINGFLGLKMYVFVENQQLRYESKGYVLKIGKLKLPIPEWLALGHASIVETENDPDDTQTFNMDFKLVHPLFGEVFSYKGKFVTQEKLTNL